MLKDITIFTSIFGFFLLTCSKTLTFCSIVLFLIFHNLCLGSLLFLISLLIMDPLLEPYSLSSHCFKGSFPFSVYSFRNLNPFLYLSLSSKAFFSWVLRFWVFCDVVSPCLSGSWLSHIYVNKLPWTHQGYGVCTSYYCISFACPVPLKIDVIPFAWSDGSMPPLWSSYKVLSGIGWHLHELCRNFLYPSDYAASKFLTLSWTSYYCWSLRVAIV